ncbi:hypothetical protein [Actinomadura rayongensis]|uniref:Uncharacterized protein n=1 Tax=Actinomadura rayongensis TaxID=1429076 RepID=A0A6I4WDC4_9ACTN|nr:hypothetical protein [Actinomadura rayongensis]MXQ68237.1 hypothetical protein [Actinomadura rayongensis]
MRKTEGRAEKIRELLDEVARLHEQCGRLLGGNVRPGVGKIAKTPPAAAPFNIEAAEARSKIQSFLIQWARVVVVQRRVSAPRCEVSGLAAFLGTHAAWVAGHPAAEAVPDQLASLVARARYAAFPEERPQSIGRCVEPGCGGRLLRRAGSDQEPAQIECSRDPGHVWRSHEWLDLRRRIGQRS